MGVKVVPFVVIRNQQTCKKWFLVSHDIIFIIILFVKICQDIKKRKEKKKKISGKSCFFKAHHDFTQARLMSSNRLFWLTMMCAIIDDQENIHIWEFDILCQENESRFIDYQNWCRLGIRRSTYQLIKCLLIWCKTKICETVRIFLCFVVRCTVLDRARGYWDALKSYWLHGAEAYGFCIHFVFGVVASDNSTAQ